MKEMLSIWKMMNISTVLFLKLFDDICNNAINYGGYIYPIHYLAFEYGLLKCYITKDNNLLALVFNSSVALQDLKLTQSKYYNFIDRLIDSKYYHSIEQHKNNNESYVIVFLKIPLEYKKDINLIIENSMFSKLSNNFKEKMKPCYTQKNKSMYIPIINNPKARFLIKNDIPYGIVNKGKNLTKLIKRILDIEDEPLELYNKWDSDKEIYNVENLNKSILEQKNIIKLETKIIV